MHVLGQNIYFGKLCFHIILLYTFFYVCVCGGGGSGTFVNTSIDVWDEISDCSKNA